MVLRRFLWDMGVKLAWGHLWSWLRDWVCPRPVEVYRCFDEFETSDGGQVILVESFRPDGSKFVFMAFYTPREHELRTYGPYEIRPWNNKGGKV